MAAWPHNAFFLSKKKIQQQCYGSSPEGIRKDTFPFSENWAVWHKEAYQKKKKTLQCPNPLTPTREDNLACLPIQSPQMQDWLQKSMRNAVCFDFPA